MIAAKITAIKTTEATNANDKDPWLGIGVDDDKGVEAKVGFIEVEELYKGSGVVYGTRAVSVSGCTRVSHGSGKVGIATPTSG